MLEDGSSRTEAFVDFPTSGAYILVLEARAILPNADDIGAIAQVRIDQKPISVSDEYALFVKNTNSFLPYTLKQHIAAGERAIDIVFVNGISGATRRLFIDTIAIKLDPIRPAPAVEPPGQPRSLVATVQFVQCLEYLDRFKGKMECATRCGYLRYGSGWINAGEWSQPFCLGQPSDPLLKFFIFDPGDRRRPVTEGISSDICPR